MTSSFFMIAFIFHLYRYVRRMTLGTGNIVTLVTSSRALLSLTLDINNRRVYGLNYKTNVIFSSDYHGKNTTNIRTPQPLNPYTLDVSERSIFLMANNKSRILMVNKTKEDVFRSFTIEKSYYYKLIMFNKVNHQMGKWYILSLHSIYTIYS